jgi:hypothetical protein
MARALVPFFVCSSVLLFAMPRVSHAQLPDCSGHDAAGASAEFEAGNALLTQAIEQATHRHVDRAHQLATQALEHFDRQCQLGDASALAERGSALLLLGETMRSAQSYDAYLQSHPLESLDARTRRRIESNLQPGTIELDVANPRGHVFVDDVDFGALPRTTPMRLPLGTHRVEVRDDAGAVLVTDETSLTAEASHASIHFIVPVVETVVVSDTPPEEHVTPPPPPPPPTAPAAAPFDFLPFYIASGITAGVGLALGIAFLVVADDRARNYNATCHSASAPGCSGMLDEYNAYFGSGVAAIVLGGLGVAGLVTTWLLDASQPRAHLHVAFGPTGLALSGTF